VELKPGPGWLTDSALDGFVAPELSKLERPELRSLSELELDAANWLSEFLLNHFLRFRLAPRERQFRFALIRRTAAAIAEYELGRTALEEYLDGTARQLVSPYFRALRHFEAAAASTYQALSLGSSLIERARPLFDKQKDGNSDFARLERVYVHSKHADQLFDSKQVNRDLTLTVWLTTEGLKCAQAVVTFAELTDMLVMLGRVARDLVDPSRLSRDEVI
jgi:hypothetical protein